MDSNGKWEFKCPQFVDFNEIDKFDPELESYFDKNMDDKHFCPRVFRKSTVLQEMKNKIQIDFANTVNESSSPGARKRSVYTFTAAFSKPKPPAVENKNKENPFIVHHVKSEKSFKSAFAVSKTAKTDIKRPPAIRRVTPRSGVRNKINKHVAIIKPVGKLEVKPSTSSHVPPERRRVPSPPPPPPAAPPVRRKTTRPQTPQCLKRSMIKASTKVIKTSEQIELERIAAMRRKMKSDLNINKAAMKKTRAPALRPLPEKKEKPAVPPKVEQRKNGPVHQQEMRNNEAIFKKPAMMTKAKSFIGFGTHARQPLVRQNTTPYALRTVDRRATRSDSSTPSISKLTASTSKSGSLKSLSAFHSGVVFIPKQDQKSLGALKMKPTGQENKNAKTTTSETSRNKPNIKSKSQGSAFFRSRSTISKAINTSQPFKDRTNAMSTSYKTAAPQKPVLKRKSSETLIQVRSEKRIKIAK